MLHFAVCVQSILVQSLIAQRLMPSTMHVTYILPTHSDCSRLFCSSSSLCANWQPGILQWPLSAWQAHMMKCSALFLFFFLPDFLTASACAGILPSHTAMGSAKLGCNSVLTAGLNITTTVEQRRYMPVQSDTAAAAKEVAPIPETSQNC